VKNISDRKLPKHVAESRGYSNTQKDAKADNKTKTVFYNTHTRGNTIA
jgi:hypothetical protein